MPSWKSRTPRSLLHFQGHDGGQGDLCCRPLPLFGPCRRTDRSWSTSTRPTTPPCAFTPYATCPLPPRAEPPGGAHRGRREGLFAGAHHSSPTLQASSPAIVPRFPMESPGCCHARPARALLAMLLALACAPDARLPPPDRSAPARPYRIAAARSSSPSPTMSATSTRRSARRVLDVRPAPVVRPCSTTSGTAERSARAGPRARAVVIVWDDGLVYTFEAAAGRAFLRWRAGRGGDFVYTFDRLLSLDLPSPGAQFYTGIVGAEERLAGRCRACRRRARGRWLDVEIRLKAGMPRSRSCSRCRSRRRSSARTSRVPARASATGPWARGRSSWCRGPRARPWCSSAIRTTGTRSCPTSTASRCTCWSRRRSRRCASCAASPTRSSGSLPTTTCVSRKHRNGSRTFTNCRS